MCVNRGYYKYVCVCVCKCMAVNVVHLLVYIITCLCYYIHQQGINKSLQPAFTSIKVADHYSKQK